MNEITDEHGSVILSRKSFAGRKGFFFAKSSRFSRLRGESWAGLSPRRREAREENAKDFSLVAAGLPRVHLWFQFVVFTRQNSFGREFERIA